jgi:two-component system chemotaxis response regulator CheY
MVITSILNEAGHEVVAQAADGEEAVQLFREFKPDIMTMDITMPKLDGIAAVRLINEMEPLARIIMVTAIGQRAIITDAIKAGADDFIVKPFDKDKVLETVRRVLSRS